MKRVKCKSGTTGWQIRLRKQYEYFELFQAYDENYNISGRLGFKSAGEAWWKNPTIQGSTNPSDLCVVKDKSWRKIGNKEFRLHSTEGTMLHARAQERELKANGYVVKFISRGKHETGCYVYKHKIGKDRLYLTA